MSTIFVCDICKKEFRTIEGIFPVKAAVPGAVDCHLCENCMKSECRRLADKVTSRYIRPDRLVDLHGLLETINWEVGE